MLEIADPRLESEGGALTFRELQTLQNTYKYDLRLRDPEKRAQRKSGRTASAIKDGLAVSVVALGKWGWLMGHA